MIDRVGLLNEGLEDMATTAWDIYSNWEYAGQPYQKDHSMVDEFKKTFSRGTVKIHFMGLWDTVNSVGILTDKLFPYSVRSSIAEHVRHAVSIDERRSKFKQVMFEQCGEYPGYSCGLVESRNTYHESSISSLFNGFRRRKSERLESWPSEDIIEMYFPGNHGDCGGG